MPNMPALNYTPPSSGAQFFEDLESIAYDDAIAARALGMELCTCLRGPKSKQELDEQITSLKQESRLVDEGAAQANDQNPFDYAEAIQRVEQSYRYCSSLSEDQLARAEEFLELGSQGGDFLASAALYEQYLSEGDWEPLFEVSQRLWDEHGSATALSALVLIYDEGYLDDFQIGTTPNRVTTHALNIVSSEVTFLGYGQYYDSESDFRVQIDDALSKTAEKLSPQEHLEAEEIAIKIISENENCCMLF